MEGDEPNHIFEQEQCKFAFSMIAIPLRKLKVHWNYEIQSLLCCWRILENILKSLNSQAVMLIMCVTLILKSLNLQAVMLIDNVFHFNFIS